MRKKVTLAFLLIGLVAVLAGCNINEPINADSTGFWSVYVVLPLSQLLTFFADLTGDGNYGLSIIIVTIIIRLVLLPLMIKQTKSSRAMQDLQPQMKELREKYSSKDQKTQQQLQQEMMQLFQKNGVNPLAGCLPILVQMPILLGFYHAIMRTTAIETHTFLWFSLGDADITLALLAGVTTFIQQKIMMGSGGAVQPQMKMLLYVMPIMIIVFAINFPSALALYWVVGNIFMIVQTYFITRPATKTASTDTEGAKK
ncbi:YidC family membrane integrase SpoIIIJ [Guptibacillus algicola]|uniref:YidC family membrane integrase SpoIIIJ n=1 Tax=Guptibacillus algicola TaxID=225844 RepID=UPI001CD6D959|nr:YidC family membrane integrase SpoIIIJ [Alkalihalobacillus algicola]MCA0988768.1 YidC family membrane integrase SpoIIIJ [Alkalihalobacillus algicola]